MSHHGLYRWAMAIACALMFVPSRAAARELWGTEDGEFSLELGSTFKSSLMVSRGPAAPLLFPERDSGASLSRLRFDLGATLSEWVTVGVAYEQRARLSSSPNPVLGLAALPSTLAIPHRIAPIDQAFIDQSPTFVYAHELDRLFVAIHLPVGEVTLGRQAIGMGRGTLFGAVDLFAPFSPVEVDREWRRGIDAARFEVRFIEQLSADVTAAFDDEFNDYSLVGRLRAYVGEFDAAAMVGKRLEDTFAGGALSAVVGDAELHGEMALFGTDGRGVYGGFLDTERVVLKAVAGGSYSFDVGSGLRLFAEYHYSGFGLEDIREDAMPLLDAAFRARLTRGDSQILGRHAIAATVGYDLFDEVAASVLGLVSPVDGSGMCAPQLAWSYSDGVTLTASAFLPWGPGPRGVDARSEYGLSAYGAFLQASIYD